MGNPRVMIHVSLNLINPRWVILGVDLWDKLYNMCCVDLGTMCNFYVRSGAYEVWYGDLEPWGFVWLGNVVFPYVDHVLIYIVLTIKTLFITCKIDFMWYVMFLEKSVVFDMYGMWVSCGGSCRYDSLICIVGFWDPWFMWGSWCLLHYSIDLLLLMSCAYWLYIPWFMCVIPEGKFLCFVLCWQRGCQVLLMCTRGIR